MASGIDGRPVSLLHEGAKWNKSVSRETIIGKSVDVQDIDTHTHTHTQSWRGGRVWNAGMVNQLQMMSWFYSSVTSTYM